MRRLFYLVISATALTGCLRVDTNPLPEFEEVRRVIACRTDETVFWDSCFQNCVDGYLCEPLTIESAVRIALLNNRDLQAVYETLGIEKANLAQAGLLTNPAFSLSWRFSTAPAVPDIVDWGLLQNLLETLLIPLKKRVAAHELEAAKLMVAARILDVIGRTKIAFYMMLAEEEAWKLKEQELLALECTSEAAERLFQAGNIKELEVNGRRTAYEAAKIEAADIEMRVLDAREELNRLMGLWGTQICWNAEGSLPDMLPCSWTDVENRAIANNLDLREARSRLSAIAAAVGVDISRTVFPQAEIGANGEREDGNWFIGPAFALSIPIFDLGKAAAAAGQAEVFRQWNMYTAMAVDIRSAARSMRLHLLNAARQWRHYREKIIPLAEKTLALTLLQHNAMQLGVLDLLDAKREEIRSKLEAVAVQKAYLEAEIELETLMLGHRL